jgi:hypothetical protein
MRMRKSAPVKKSAHVKKSPRFGGAIGTRAVVVGVACVIGAAMVIAARQPSPTEMTRDAKPERAAPGSIQAKRAATAKDAVMASTVAPDMTDVNTPAGASAKAGPTSPPVTLTGCLERDDKVFRLKDALGHDAPKSRSWKSGFLKKSAAAIEVVDVSHNLKLPNHVGQRVSVTGVIANREIQVRSMQRLATSCNSSVKPLDH